MRFSNFDEIAQYLDEQGLFHMDLTLARVEAFARSFGPPGFLIAHVAGTNGKGSTAAFLERLSREHGVRTGLYTSPHFLNVRERVLVDGLALDPEAWVEAANEVHAFAGAEDLTYFEFLTCLAVSIFRRCGVQLAVMEAGLGGKYDAVRAFDANVSVLTHIGLDHMQVLGSTLAYIARDKAHVIRPGTPAFTAEQQAEVEEVLQARARSVGTELTVARPYAREVGMRGAHQQANAGLALAAWSTLADELGVPRRVDREERAMQEAFIPGRLQYVREDGVTWMLDGAHNEPALRALADAVDKEGVCPESMVVSCMRDKDLERMVPLLHDICAGRILCPSLPWYERMLPGQELAEALGTNAEACGTPEQAFQEAASGVGPVLICGSLYLLAEFYKLYPEHLTRTMA
ncbi:dihydrofolate synthase / folylpolyglutamate synthase [Paucidesulfovibrio gracilis DSM 16080]|uniref:Dihydrofolate synthase/folylpolyglutamate synthase n=1 Tax=Paucidesulfovibrio gracilis DSM 16080 TaxID=1121449 RepID=A0A1T4WJ26_9BACT|nr:Mur ligase family protein [Paucidesulfovibrio gracilis]SKA77356.1 dihydrofolate synthase / folylpolyglutamate synthase [Paucidesulfovibrio gracilis DSM 16080]